MITLECYDACWTARFQEEAAALQATFGALARRIEHVGSTAVPGLIAKPIIDVQVSVPSLAPFMPLMTELGYSHLPDGDHVHLCEVGSSLGRRHIAFRDCLRADARARERYAALKRELAELHQGSTHEERQRYADGKSEFVRELQDGLQAGRDLI